MLKDLLEKYRDKTTSLEHEVKGFLREIGLQTPEGIFIKEGDRIPLLKLAYPLVAKVSSSRIISKTEVNGVRIGIKDENELTIAIAELMQIKDAEGVLVEEMAPRGVEVIVGGIIDEQFGPIVMFGLGGVFVELFKDVAFALAPLDKDKALWLIQQIKGYRLLEGYRGRPPVDINSLLNIIITVSEIIATNMIKEIDLNPLSLYQQGAMILDAKMKFKPMPPLLPS